MTTPPAVPGPPTPEREPTVSSDPWTRCPADNLLAAWLHIGKHLGLDNDDMHDLLAHQLTQETTAHLMTRPTNP